MRAMLTDGVAATRIEGSHVDARRAAVRPHGNWESRIIKLAFACWRERTKIRSVEG